MLNDSPTYLSTAERICASLRRLRQVQTKADALSKPVYEDMPVYDYQRVTTIECAYMTVYAFTMFHRNVVTFTISAYFDIVDWLKDSRY